MDKLAKKLTTILSAFTLVTIVVVLMSLVFCGFLAFISHSNILDIMSSPLMGAITFVGFLLAQIMGFAYLYEENKL